MSERPTELHRLRSQAKARHDHARGCEKPLDACKECKLNMAWFASLPLATLSTVLEERKTV